MAEQWTRIINDDDSIEYKVEDITIIRTVSITELNEKKAILQNEIVSLQNTITKIDADLVKIAELEV